LTGGSPYDIVAHLPPKRPGSLQNDIMAVTPMPGKSLFSCERSSIRYRSYVESKPPFRISKTGLAEQIPRPDDHDMLWMAGPEQAVTSSYLFHIARISLKNPSGNKYTPILLLLSEQPQYTLCPWRTATKMNRIPCHRRVTVLPEGRAARSTQCSSEDGLTLVPNTWPAIHAPVRARETYESRNHQHRH
jgi:hypothetical protein